jgi:hypothetical protein
MKLGALLVLPSIVIVHNNVMINVATQVLSIASDAQINFLTLCTLNAKLILVLVLES